MKVMTMRIGDVIEVGPGIRIKALKNGMTRIKVGVHAPSERRIRFIDEDRLGGPDELESELMAEVESAEEAHGLAGGVEAG